jgi:hypothetical protein
MTKICKKENVKFSRVKEHTYINIMLYRENVSDREH